MVAFIFLVMLLCLFTFVVLMISMSKANALSRKLELLESGVQSLRNELERLKAADLPPISGEVHPPVAGSHVPVVPSTKADVQKTGPLPDDGSGAMSKPGEPQLQFITPTPPRPSRTREEWEAFIGGKLLNRIGALALILGVGFFLKYAFDNNWITETMRVVIGLAAGGGLLVLAARTYKKKFEVFAQGLVGAGIAVLYLSCYASFNFYHLVSQPVAFALMAGVTVLSFTRAFKYDSLAVALLAWAGGFLTPCLLSTGEANELGLFTYIALLDAGIVAVAIAKEKWTILEPLSLLATYLIYALWYAEYRAKLDFAITAYCIVVFWLIFLAADIYGTLKGRHSTSPWRHIMAAGNAFLFYFALFLLVERHHQYATSVVTLGLALVYCVVALIVFRQRRDSEGFLIRQILTAIVLVVLATSIEFSGFRKISWWSMEALALVWCGVHWNRRFVWYSGIALFGLTALTVLGTAGTFNFEPIDAFVPLANRRAVALFLLASASVLGGFMSRGQRSESAAVLTRSMFYLGCASLFMLVSVEVADTFNKRIGDADGLDVSALRYSQILFLGVVWMLYAAAIVWWWLRMRLDPFLHAALAAAFLAALIAVFSGWSYSPIERFALLANSRAGVLAFIALGSGALALWLKPVSTTSKLIALAVSALRVVVPILFFVLLTGEVIDSFEKQKLDFGDAGGTDFTRLDNLQQLVLSGVWLAYSIVVMALGLVRRLRSLRVISIVLFGITIFKMFLLDLSFLETLYRIFSFIGLGLILLAVSYLYQRYKDIIFGVAAPDALMEATKPETQSGEIS